MSQYPGIKDGIIELLYDNGAVNCDAPPVEEQVKRILGVLIEDISEHTLALADDFLLKLKQNSPNLWQEFRTGEYTLIHEEGELAADNVMNYVFEIMKEQYAG